MVTQDLLLDDYLLCLEAPEAALIGRVGERVFLIGAGGTVPKGVTGALELMINDDLDALYGQGLTDNAGSIDILITTSAVE